MEVLQSSSITTIRELFHSGMEQLRKKPWDANWWNGSINWFRSLHGTTIL